MPSVKVIIVTGPIRSSSVYYLCPPLGWASVDKVLPQPALGRTGCSSRTYWGCGGFEKMTENKASQTQLCVHNDDNGNNNSYYRANTVALYQPAMGLGKKAM